MADEQGSEEASLLQAKLGDLDIETLKKLLQTAISNKTKETEQHGGITPAPPSTTSTDADQTHKNGTTEMNDEIESNKATNGSAGSSEISFNGGDDDNEQAEIMADEDLSPDNNFSPDNDLSQNILPHSQKKGSYFAPTEVKNTGNSNAEKIDLICDMFIRILPSILLNRQYSFVFLISGEQVNEAIALSKSPNTATVNLQALKINEDDDSEELTSRVYEKPALTSTPGQSFTLGDTNQFTGFVNKSGQGDYLHKTFPYDQQNPPLNQASMGQNPETIQHHMYSQSKQTLSNTQWDAPSNTQSGIGKLDQKPVIMPAEQQNFQPSTNQFDLPSNQPPASYDQEYKTEPSSTSIPSSNSSEDFPLKDFPSVVPPLYIPISKVSQYLPEGTAICNSESWIPLPLRPVIVLKNKVAVMVFERDDG